MFLYLHGFASGPGSSKARLFRDRLAALGIEVRVPALDGGDFEHLTLTGQLRRVERELARGSGPTVLVGSSLGGYLAALRAASHPVDALVLMAPAVGFLPRWRAKMGEEAWQRWRGGRPLPVFHHALGREAPLAFDLMADAERYPEMPRFSSPALVLHGRRDEVVPQRGVEEFAALNGARLELFDSGHELVEVADAIFERARDFLAGVEPVRRAWPALAR